MKRIFLVAALLAAALAPAEAGTWGEKLSGQQQPITKEQILAEAARRAKRETDQARAAIEQDIADDKLCRDWTVTRTDDGQFLRTIYETCRRRLNHQWQKGQP
jgi:hypothetical protein